MFANLALNRVVTISFLLAVIYSGLVTLVPAATLIIVLNGVFVGCMVAITVAYHRLIWFALLGVGDYNRVRQMTLGFAIAWAAIGVGAINSIYLRSIGADIPATALTAATRYLAIIAAVLQVTAPDFGLGLFHGRDRRVLWSGALLGSVAAIFTIVLQDGSLLF